MRRITRALLAGVSLAALSSCGDGTGPSQPLMLFALRSIDGARLPAHPLSSADYAIVQHLLILERGGGGTERRVLRPDDGRPDITVEVPIRWRGNGRALEMWEFCLTMGIVPCPAEPTLSGPVDGQRWVVTDSYRYHTPAVFERLQ